MPNVEEHLRQAMEEGKFDNLPGKGKPLRLEENPNADPEWELAFHLIKESGFSLPWIETIREIESDLEKARLDLKRAWDWQQATQTADQPHHLSTAEWDRAIEAFQEKLAALNQRIRDYNLEVPNVRFQRPILKFERELEKITEI
jgi:DnaJ homolog subfamily C member 28